MRDHDKIVRLERDLHWMGVLDAERRHCDRELVNEQLRSRDLALQLQAAVHAQEASALAVAKDQLAQAKGGGLGTARLVAMTGTVVAVLGALVGLIFGVRP